MEIAPGGIPEALAELARALVDAGDEALAAAGGAAPEVVVAVGGVACAPAVRRALETRWGAPVRSAAPGVVALGAAAFAGGLPEEGWTRVGGEEGPAFPERPPLELTGVFLPLPSARRAAPRWADNFLPILDRAQALYEEGRLEDSIGAFDHLFAELAKYGSDLYRRAATAREARGDPDGAIGILRAAHARERGNPLVAGDLASACMRRSLEIYNRGSPGGALPFLTAGIDAVEPLAVEDRRFDRLLAGMLHLRARSLAEVGRREDACGDAERSVRLDPAQPQYRQTLERLGATPPPAERAPDRPHPGRNELCSCGSRRKYKHCCGRSEAAR